jgi:alpha-tubulin suppressor-like RCC1 family protein
MKPAAEDSEDPKKIGSPSINDASLGPYPHPEEVHFIKTACGEAHTMAIPSDGYGLWVWGWGVYGQLGLGFTKDDYPQVRY